MVVVAGVLTPARWPWPLSLTLGNHQVAAHESLEVRPDILRSTPNLVAKADVLSPKCNTVDGCVGSLGLTDGSAFHELRCV